MLLPTERLTRREWLARTGGVLAAAAATRHVRAQRGSRVIVVGAGLAGLCAAYELVQSGHDVTVLEARDRPGGRVYTIRDPFAPGLWADAGAETIFGTHSLTMAYVKQFGLTLVPRPVSEGKVVAQIDGRRVIDPPRASPPPAWRDLLAAAAPVDADAWPPDALKKYDALTLAALWRELGASPAAIAQLRLAYLEYLGDGIDATSALNAIREAASRLGAETAYCIDGGNDGLPKAFASRIGSHIEYESPVVRIAHRDDGVRVVVRRTAGTRELAADYLVCAIPFTTLRDVEIDPPFPAEKRRAIAQLRNTAVTRTFVECRTRFWTASGLSGDAITDGALFVDDVTPAPIATRGLLEIYAAGARARALSSLSDDARRRAAVETIQTLLGGSAGIGAQASVMWHDDQWAKGAYAWFAPGEMTAFLPELARAVGRVHFAGDHTSAMPGWMQGALASGRRAAGEISRRTV